MWIIRCFLPPSLDLFLQLIVFHFLQLIRFRSIFRLSFCACARSHTMEFEILFLLISFFALASLRVCFIHNLIDSFVCWFKFQHGVIVQCYACSGEFFQCTILLRIIPVPGRILKIFRNPIEKFCRGEQNNKKRTVHQNYYWFFLPEEFKLHTNWKLSTSNADRYAFKGLRRTLIDLIENRMMESFNCFYTMISMKVTISQHRILLPLESETLNNILHFTVRNALNEELLLRIHILLWTLNWINSNND